MNAEEFNIKNRTYHWFEGEFGDEENVCQDCFPKLTNNQLQRKRGERFAVIRNESRKMTND
jgi:hypothetical protein